VWYGLAAPAATPKEFVDRLHREVAGSCAIRRCATACALSLKAD
jgi:hypothetical protein